MCAHSPLLHSCETLVSQAATCEWGRGMLVGTLCVPPRTVDFSTLWSDPLSGIQIDGSRQGLLRRGRLHCLTIRALAATLVDSAMFLSIRPTTTGIDGRLSFRIIKEPTRNHHARALPGHCRSPARSYGHRTSSPHLVRGTGRRRLLARQTPLERGVSLRAQTLAA